MRRAKQCLLKIKNGMQRVCLMKFCLILHTKMFLFISLTSYFLYSQRNLATETTGLKSFHVSSNSLKVRIKARNVSILEEGFFQSKQ